MYTHYHFSHLEAYSSVELSTFIVLCIHLQKIVLMPTDLWYLINSYLNCHHSFSKNWTVLYRSCCMTQYVSFGVYFTQCHVSKVDWSFGTYKNFSFSRLNRSPSYEYITLCYDFIHCSTFCYIFLSVIMKNAAMKQMYKYLIKRLLSFIWGINVDLSLLKHPGIPHSFFFKKEQQDYFHGIAPFKIPSGKTRVLPFAHTCAKGNYTTLLLGTQRDSTLFLPAGLSPNYQPKQWHRYQNKTKQVCSKMTRLT